MAWRTILVLFGSIVLGSSVVSAEESEKRPAALRQLIDCQGIREAAARLACYDAKVAALDIAEKKQDLVVLDRAQVRETRRSLFGFPLPKLGIFGDRTEKEIEAEDVSEIESAVRTARSLANGNWSISLVLGSGVWETTTELAVSPKYGDKVRIKKAALGSYLGSVGANRGVRFRRVG